MKYKLKPSLLEQNENKGTLAIDKGNSEGLEITTFDAISNCVMRECPIYSTCPYTKNKNKPCEIRKHYLNHCLKVLNSVPKDLNKLANLKIGFNIIPLYSQLIGFKILAHSLPVVYDGKKVHPIFKEIRETIKLISVLLRDLEPNETIENVAGNSDYYDSLFSVEQPEEKFFKRKFLKKSARNSKIRNMKKEI